VQPPNPGPPPDVYISIVPAQPTRFSDRARGRGGMGAAGHAGGFGEGNELEPDD